jgi:DNA-binding response OmpR family regulator
MLSTLQNFHTPLSSPDKISILLVSPFQEDHSSLRYILHNDGWLINRCKTLREAAGYLQCQAPSVVICERDLPDGTWKDALHFAERLPNPPLLLITSRHADDNLWAEVLNLGGYDVLMKPFDRAEVTRVVGMAWRHRLRPPPSRAASPSV